MQDCWDSSNEKQHANMLTCQPHCNYNAVLLEWDEISMLALININNILGGGLWSYLAFFHNGNELWICTTFCRVTVESLYMALKSIDRMDIVNMLEGQQGNQEQDRRRHNDRDHLSLGISNGKRFFSALTSIRPPPLSHVSPFTPKPGFPSPPANSFHHSLLSNRLSLTIWLRKFRSSVLLSPGSELRTSLQTCLRLY